MKHPAFVCCAVSFLFLGATSVQAQETSDLTDVHFYPPSAVSMMKYIDYPVSHRTGIPEISIPLYTVRSGSLELPVNLSFHLDDFTRVNQLAGAAGAGWSLSCDMQVSRIINGRDDFHASGYLSTGTSYTNIDKNTPEIIPSDQHLFSMWIKNIDEEPDKFYYKLLGSSGAFYIEKELGPTTVPMNGDRIDYANRNGNTDFSIVGRDGTKYSFSSQYVDWVRDFNAMEAPAPTAWKCTRIESADGSDAITFSYLPYESNLVRQLEGSHDLYDDAEISGSGSSMFESLARTPRQELHYGMNTSCDYFLRGDNEIADGWEMETAPEQDESAQFARKVLNTIHTHYIDRIEFRGGSLQFVYEQYNSNRTAIRRPILTRIEVYDLQGVLRKTILLTQSIDTGYYLDENLAMMYGRYLNALTIDAQRYRFEYGAMHYGDSFSDFWGHARMGSYDRGIPAIARHYTTIEKGSSPRDRHDNRLIDTPLSEYEKYIPSYYTSEIYLYTAAPKKLLTITYPTGGYTEFHCDHNQFCDRSGINRYISNYRIRDIRAFDRDSMLLKQTHYEYGANESGNGIIRHEPDTSEEQGNCHTLQTIVYYETYNGATTNTLRLRCRTYYPHTTYRTNYDDGSHVQYDEVAEYQSEGGVLSGKTVYKYTLDPPLEGSLNRPAIALPGSPYPMEMESWHQGSLDSVIQYKYVDGRFEWLVRRDYTYMPYLSAKKIFRGRVWPTTRHVQIEANGSLREQPRLTTSPYDDNKNTYSYSYNAIDVGCMQLSEEIIEQREDDGRILRRRTNYYYDTNPYTASRKETTYADGRTVTERTLYAEDYLPSSVRTMLDRNLLSLPLERVVYTDETVTHGDTFRYDLYGRPDSLSTLASLDLSPASFRFSNRSSTGGKGAYTPDTHYIGRASLRYDADGNICEVQAVGQPPICYLWGYKGQYLVAEIRNAAYDEVTTALGAATVEHIRTSVVLSEGDLAALDGLRTSRKEWHVTTATYIPLVGMASMTDPSGRETTYEYDAFGRLISVKDGKGEQVQSYDYHFATENR